jgi:hypothetical protein
MDASPVRGQDPASEELSTYQMTLESFGLARYRILIERYRGGDFHWTVNELAIVEIDTIDYLSDQLPRFADELIMRESKAVVYAVTTQLPLSDEDPDRGDIMATNMKSGLIRPRHNEKVAPEIQFLQEVVRLTGGGLLFAESPPQLQKAFEQISSEMKTRYQLSYSPTGVDREGWHELEVKVSKRGAEVKARRGYWKRVLSKN